MFPTLGLGRKDVFSLMSPNATTVCISRAVQSAMAPLGIATTTKTNQHMDATALKHLLAQPLLHFLKNLSTKDRAGYLALDYSAGDTDNWIVTSSMFCLANEQIFAEAGNRTKQVWGWKFPRAVALLPMLQHLFATARTPARSVEPRCE